LLVNELQHVARERNFKPTIHKKPKYVKKTYKSKLPDDIRLCIIRLTARRKLVSTEMYSKRRTAAYPCTT